MHILAAQALYLLVVCSMTDGSCETPVGYKPLTRAECMDRLQMIRFAHPDKRVICGAAGDRDVVDSLGRLKPERLRIAPTR